MKDIFPPGTPILPTEKQLTPTALAVTNGGIPLSQMTLREAFAGLAVAGMMANPELIEVGYDEVARHATMQADALLEVLALMQEVVE